MTRLILTIALILALLYGFFWFQGTLTDRKNDVQCRIDYGLKGCHE